jgi:parallel beta-helix repeat protein
MKTKLLSLTLIGISAVMIFSLPSCKKEAADTQGNSNQNTLSENKAVKAIVAKFDENKYNQLVAKNKARLALIEDQASRESKKSIMVPGDYATIQEAVDAASEGANIFVNAGTYTEDVVIVTAGLKLQARDGVLVIGSFILLEGADNVTIKKFSIQSPEGSDWAIRGTGVAGGQVVQNTITAEPAFLAYHQSGISMFSCNGFTVRDNVVTGPDFAITFASRSNIGDGTCNNNTFSNNTISRNFIVGIQLQGNCQYNTVANNTVSEGGDFGNGGIFIFGVPDYIGAPESFEGECNNNIIKNNYVTGTAAGIYFAFSAYDNTIGPNNTTNENIYYGILLYSGASDNNIFNNAALNNGACDIVVYDAGVPCLNNTFSNNTYDCFQEF